MKKLAMLIILMCITVTTVFASSDIGTENDGVNTITILPYERQTITGWGFFPSNYFGGILNRAASDNQDTSIIVRKGAMSMLLNDFGATMFRVDLMSGCGNGDGSLNKGWMDKLVATIKVTQESGMTDYLMTAWAPPYDMLLGAKGGYSFNPEYEDSFCTYVVNVFDYLVDEGCMLPIAFSFQNEPQDQKSWPRVTVVQYARITKKLRKALDDAGYNDVLLAGPECAAYYQHSVCMGKNYSALYEDPEFAESLGVLITHSYFFIKSGMAYDSDLYNFAMNASNFPEKERWQTEFSGGYIDELGSMSMDLGQGLRTTQIMLGDVVWGGMNRWLYWNGYESRQYRYPDKTVRFMDGKALGDHQSLTYGNGYGNVKKNNIGVALSTIWKNVPVGSVVHRAWTDDETLFNHCGLRGDLGAFVRPDGMTVLVAVNATDKAKTYNINGLTGSSAEIHVMDKDTDQVMYLSHRNVINGSIKNLEFEPYTMAVIVTKKDDISEPKITLVPDISDEIDGTEYTVTDSAVKVSGYVDEPVQYIKANGTEYEVDSDNHFDFEFDASSVKTLVLECTDPVSGKSAKSTYNVRIKSDFMKLVFTEAPSAVNNTVYTLKGCTGLPAEITVNGKSVKTDSDNGFEITVDLKEGDNHLEISAVGAVASAKTVLDVTCDSRKPNIIIDDYNKNTNDWEGRITGRVSEKLSSFTLNGDTVTVNDDLTFEAKVNLIEGANSFEFKAVDFYGNESSRSEEMVYTKNESTPHYVDSMAYARKTDEKIAIDGNFTESSWKLDMKICQQVYGIVPANNICNFGLLWDENYLYIGAEVKDSNLHWDEQYPYSNDSIEFLFNPSGRRAGSLEADDKQIFSGFVHGINGSYYQNTKAPGLKQAYRITENGYNVELAMPWEDIGAVGELGTVFGFEIVCNDDDLDGSLRSSIMSWSSESSEYYSLTDDYGLVELVEKDDFRYEDGVYKKAVVATEGADFMEVDGTVYNELGLVCEKYGAQYYDNPNTDLVNIFTSHTTRVDIKEGAYQTFVNGKLMSWKNPVIKHGDYFYIDAECENAVFDGIIPFEKYPD